MPDLVRFQTFEHSAGPRSVRDGPRQAVWCGYRHARRAHAENRGHGFRPRAVVDDDGMHRCLDACQPLKQQPDYQALMGEACAWLAIIQLQELGHVGIRHLAGHRAGRDPDHHQAQLVLWMPTASVPLGASGRLGGGNDLGHGSESTAITRRRISRRRLPLVLQQSRFEPLQQLDGALRARQASRLDGASSRAACPARPLASR